jgi:hypothetical protein
MWNGSPVAVKIVEFTSKEWAAGRLLEGLLSENLSHPNVVSGVGAWGGVRCEMLGSRSVFTKGSWAHAPVPTP